MTTSRTAVTFVAVVAALGVGACSRASGSGSDLRRSSVTLAYTAIPDQNSTELIEKFRPFSQWLSRELGLTVEYLPARDYQASVEMFANGDVGFAWFGGLTGVQARERVPGARAIAQGDVDPGYSSYLIANKHTGLTRSDTFPKEIAKYRFTFGSESSTSGRLMPEYFIRKETGKTPQEFFQYPVGFSGTHDKTAELVATGQYQVGVINYKVYEQRVRDGKTDPDVVRIIWQTPKYADYNWSARPDLDSRYGAGFIDRLAKALTSIDDAAVLVALPRRRLIAASNDQYAVIRDIAKQLEMVR